MRRGIEMRDYSKLKAFLLGLLTVIVLSLIPAVYTWAMDVTISMDTESDYYNSDSEFDVDVHIRGSENIGTYYIEVEYDEEKLIYLSGADRSTDGRILLSSTGFSNDITYKLTFKTIKAGEAGYVVSKAYVNAAPAAGGQAATINEESYYLHTINVAGTNEGAYAYSDVVAEQKEIAALNTSVLGAFTDANGEIHYVVDLSKESVPELVFPYELEEDKYDSVPICYATDANKVLKILALMDRSGQTALYSIKDDQLYKLHEYTDPNGIHYIYCESAGCLQIPSKLDGNKEMQQYAVYAIADNGDCGFYLFDKSGELVSWSVVYNELNGTSEEFWDIITRKDTAAVPWERYLIIAGVATAFLILIFIVAAIIAAVRYRKREKRRRAEAAKKKNEARRAKQKAKQVIEAAPEDKEKQPEKAGEVPKANVVERPKQKAEQEPVTAVEIVATDETEVPVDIEEYKFEAAAKAEEKAEVPAEKTIVISALPIRSKKRYLRDEQIEQMAREAVSVDDIEAEDLEDALEEAFDDIQFTDETLEAITDPEAIEAEDLEDIRVEDIEQVQKADNVEDIELEDINTMK